MGGRPLRRDCQPDRDDVTITGVTVDSFEDLGSGLVRYTTATAVTPCPRERSRSNQRRRRLRPGGQCQQRPPPRSSINRTAPTGTLVDPIPGTLTNHDQGPSTSSGPPQTRWASMRRRSDVDDVTITGVSVDSFEDLGGGLVRYTYSGGGRVAAGGHDPGATGRRCGVGPGRQSKPGGKLFLHDIDRQWSNGRVGVPASRHADKRRCWGMSTSNGATSVPDWILRPSASTM
jgi:hypothetical protein